jgi:hypothetical protein
MACNVCSMTKGIEFMRFCTALFLSAAFVAAPLLTAQTTAAPSDPQTSGQSKAHTHHPMPKPTNLQVLPKDISGEQLITMMRGFEKALGVECSFCHAENKQTQRLDFASDAKPEKATARIMITMTKDINAKYLSTVNDPDASPAQKTVTCGTCHRGDSMPAPFASAKSQSEYPSPTAKP